MSVALWVFSIAKNGAKVCQGLAGWVVIFLRLSAFSMAVMTVWGFNALKATWLTGVNDLLFTKRIII
jgi:hypothetical protein